MFLENFNNHKSKGKKMAKQFKNAKQFFTVFVTVAIFLIASTAKAADDPIPLYQSSHNIKTLIS